MSLIRPSWPVKSHNVDATHGGPQPFKCGLGQPTCACMRAKVMLLEVRSERLWGEVCVLMRVSEVRACGAWLVKRAKADGLP